MSLKVVVKPLELLAHALALLVDGPPHQSIHLEERNRTFVPLA
jgi:hypothetical protein